MYIQGYGLYQHKVGGAESICNLIQVYIFCSNFETVTSAMYGSCYSFNSNFSGAASKIWESSLPGPIMGLKIVLNLAQSAYMRNSITKSAGAR